MTKQTFDRKKLVVLIYIGNTGTTRIAECDDPEVEKSKVVIDMQAGTWQRPGRHDTIQTLAIGGRAIGYDQLFTSGVIGVYDRTKFDHLKVFSEDIKKAGSRRR